MKKSVLILSLFLVAGLVVSGCNIQQAPEEESKDARTDPYCPGNCKQPGGCGKGCECGSYFFGLLERCRPTTTEESTE